MNSKNTFLIALLVFVLLILGIGYMLYSYAFSPGSNQRNISYGANSLQKLDIYAAENCPAEGCPTIIYVHGGAWINGDKSERLSKPMFEMLRQRGVTSLSINYRLSPAFKHPAHVDDIASAIVWARQNAATYKLDPRKLFLVGHSSGAHLVTLVGTAPEIMSKAGLDASRDLAGIVAVDSGAYSLIRYNALKARHNAEINTYDVFEESEFIAASPMLRVTPGRKYPRMLFLYASDNQESRDQAYGFAQALVKAGARGSAVSASYGPEIKDSHARILHELGEPERDHTAAMLNFMGLN